MVVRSKHDYLPEYFLTDLHGNKIDYVSDLTLLGVEWNQFLNNDQFLDQILKELNVPIF